jgi:SAM-dependent methyltransferase
MSKKLRLDLACGNNKRRRFIGVDLAKDGTQADVEHDLENYPWPFGDNTVDEVFCSHFIEHVSDMIAFMNELWRVMKPGGTLQFIAPYYTSVRASQDPTHKRFISEETFYYFDREWRAANRLGHYPICCDFKVELIEHSLNPDYSDQSAEVIAHAARHFWNVIDEISVTLRKAG